MTLKFGVEEHLNEFLELLRRHDEANGANPDRQVKKACIISNAPEPLKTSSAERWTAGKLRWASRGDRRYSRADASSGRHPTRTHPMMIRWKSTPCPGKGCKFRKGKRSKDSHTGKGYSEEPTEKPSCFEGECRNCGLYGHKAADGWHKYPKPQGKGEIKSIRSERE